MPKIEYNTSGSFALSHSLSVCLLLLSMFSLLGGILGGSDQMNKWRYIALYKTMWFSRTPFQYKLLRKSQNKSHLCQAICMSTRIISAGLRPLCRHSWGPLRLPSWQAVVCLNPNVPLHYSWKCSVNLSCKLVWILWRVGSPFQEPSKISASDTCFFLQPMLEKEKHWNNNINQYKIRCLASSGTGLS